MNVNACERYNSQIKNGIKSPIVYYTVTVNLSSSYKWVIVKFIIILYVYLHKHLTSSYQYKNIKRCIYTIWNKYPRKNNIIYQIWFKQLNCERDSLLSIVRN